MKPTVSIIIPVHNGAALLERSLAAITWATPAPLEVIVVDDGSTDGSGEIARRYGAKVLETGRRSGPARARNLGARAARGDIVLFIDADVRVREATVARVGRAFEADPELDALIGSYDDHPAAPGFVSQYKNLLHSFVHQTGARHASTFFSGCGAIRRDVLLAHGGFDESYDRPAVEDIELGYRLIRASCKIELDPDLLVTHLKRWTFLDLIRSDIFDRAIPWTELILRERSMPDDLNLRTAQRASVLLTFLLVALVPLGAWELTLAAPSSGHLFGGAALIVLAAVLALNGAFYRFLARRRGLGFAVAAIPLQLLYHLYSGASFGYAVAAHAIRAIGAPLEAPVLGDDDGADAEDLSLDFSVGEAGATTAEPARARSAGIR